MGKKGSGEFCCCKDFDLLVERGHLVYASNMGSWHWRATPLDIALYFCPKCGKKIIKGKVEINEAGFRFTRR